MRDRTARSRFLVFLAALALMVPFGGASASPLLPDSSPAAGAGVERAGSLPGLIAGWESYRGVYTVEPGKPATLQYFGREGGSPTWSPDGERLAFIQGDGTGLTAEVVITDRQGNDLDKAVTGVRNLFAVDWSPDGTRMAYSCLTEDRQWTELCLVDLTTGETEMLTDPTDDIGLTEPRSRISWSPDGNLIAFSGVDAYDCPTGSCRRSVVVLVDPAVGEPSVYPADGSSYAPDFSPDGSEIAFSNYPDGVMVGPTPGYPGAVRQVVSLEHSGDHDSEDPSQIISAWSYPTWSPDGGAIAFLSDTDGAVQENADVFIVDEQGGPIVNTTMSDNTDDEITWAQPVPGCTIEGTPKRDKLVGTSAGDIICGAGGNDVIRGKGGDDRIVGGGGDDELIGQDGEDTLLGEAGADILSGGGQKDTFAGDAGKDTLLARDGVKNEQVDGGGGRDECRADPTDDVVRCE